MEYMFVKGFLGTRAPFFMDFVTLIVSALPFLVVGSIWFARVKQYKRHILSQLFLYLLSVIVVSYFEYGVRVGGGFEAFSKGSSLSDGFLLEFLIFHIIISTITVIWWTKTLIVGLRSYSSDHLLGTLSLNHRRDGLISMVGIISTSLTGIWVYLFLFVY